jgi:hypothetical protein
MISRPQQILLKRGQREAGVEDAEYRDALASIAGVRSSKDPKLTDRDLDKLLAYFEAIHWRGIDAGRLQPSCSATAVFRQRGYWQHKNTGTETSRDRYRVRAAAGTPRAEITRLEGELAALGFGGGYCGAIRSKVIQRRTDDASLWRYKAALERTLKAKLKSAPQAGNPF